MRTLAHPHPTSQKGDTWTYVFHGSATWKNCTARRRSRRRATRMERLPRQSSERLAIVQVPALNNPICKLSTTPTGVSASPVETETLILKFVCEGPRPRRATQTRRSYSNGERGLAERTDRHRGTERSPEHSQPTLTQERRPCTQPTLLEPLDSHVQNMNLDTDLTPVTTMNSKWIRARNVKCKTMKLLGDSVREYVDDPGFGDDF